MDQLAHDPHTLTLPFFSFFLQASIESIITGCNRMATRAGMKRAFLNRAWPILQILGLPLWILPERVSWEETYKKQPFSEHIRLLQKT